MLGFAIRHKYFLQAAFVALLVSVSTGLPAATDEKGFVIQQVDDFDWGPDLSKVKTIVLHGDPSAAGWYIIRIRFPAGGRGERSADA